jgi:DNA ligase (NAD+)
MPTKCPACGGDVVKEEPYVAHRCINPFCAAQRLERLRHFAGAMDIEGLGYSTLQQLIDQGLVTEPSGLYRLAVEQLAGLERYAEKSAQNLKTQIDASREPELSRFLGALGIPQVGWATAELLAAEFGSVEALRNASEAELVRVDGVGPNMAREIHMFFAGPGGELAQRLLDVGVRPQAEAAPAEGPFTGKTFVFTGMLESMSRPEAEALVKNMGGKAASSVSAKTDFVVAGPGAGSKLDKAQKLKLEILDESGFLKLVGRG